MRDRKAMVDAASYIYFRMHEMLHYATADDDSNDMMEQVLVTAFEKAKTDLDNYRTSRAFRRALDSMIPGWVYVDASEFLPKAKWGKFVSNKPGEWEAWLIENGVDVDVAKQLVQREFGLER